ncbi:MAG: phytanoyl-CoA dioxygenase family protein [Actinomycetota bacterium]
MDVPAEFTPEAVAAASGPGSHRPFAPFLDGGEPYASMLQANPWMRRPRSAEELVWGEGRYYDTTVARKHEYWSAVDLPRPTKDLHRMRLDFDQWGYCLIEDGLAPDRCQAIRARVVEQAAAERALGLDFTAPFLQLVWALVNKGDCFVGCLEHDPATVQAGPVIEQLLEEILGRNWYAYSFVANISAPGGLPQGLHQDQTAVHPFQTRAVPILVNTMYILEDVDEVNGGTLVIPGSHRIMAAAGSAGEVGALPRPINLEAPAGTVALLDGRLLHGAAINHSADRRYVLTQSNVKPWLRQQENFMLSVRPEVLASASPKLRQRLGFQATGAYGVTEGHGWAGDGTIDDAPGDLSPIRRAVDDGCYRRMGELTVDEAASTPPEAFTLHDTLGRAGARRAGPRV